MFPSSLIIYHNRFICRTLWLHLPLRLRVEWNMLRYTDIVWKQVFNYTIVGMRKILEKGKIRGTKFTPDKQLFFKIYLSDDRHPKPILCTQVQTIVCFQWSFPYMFYIFIVPSSFFASSVCYYPNFG